MGFKFRRPSMRAVLSPSLSAIQACATSWKVSASRIAGIAISNCWMKSEENKAVPYPVKRGDKEAGEMNP